VYDLFNKVLVLSQGNTIYFGDSSTAGVLRWFEHALHRSLPRGTSIPDFVLDLVNVSFLEEEDGMEKEMEGGEEGEKRLQIMLALTEEQQGSSSSCTSASSSSSPSPPPPLGLRRRGSIERRTKKGRRKM
jgi:hypothetical protein